MNSISSQSNRTKEHVWSKENNAKIINLEYASRKLAEIDVKVNHHGSDGGDGKTSHSYTYPLLSLGPFTHSSNSSSSSRRSGGPLEFDHSPIRSPCNRVVFSERNELNMLCSPKGRLVVSNGGMDGDNSGHDFTRSSKIQEVASYVEEQPQLEQQDVKDKDPRRNRRVFLKLNDHQQQHQGNQQLWNNDFLLRQHEIMNRQKKSTAAAAAAAAGVVAAMMNGTGGGGGDDDQSLDTGALEIVRQHSDATDILSPTPGQTPTATTATTSNAPQGPAVTTAVATGCVSALELSPGQSLTRGFGRRQPATVHVQHPSPKGQQALDADPQQQQQLQQQLQQQHQSPLLSPNTDRLAHEHRLSNTGLRFHDCISPVPGPAPAAAPGPEGYKYLTARGDIELLSPRSRYINACFRKHLNPRQMLSSKITEDHLELQHQGLGDAMCSVFIECFSGMDGLNTVNLADNNLTDVGLSQALNYLATLQKLHRLDVSSNALGVQSATVLHIWLRRPNCPLAELRVHKCGIDDTSSHSIISGLALAGLCSHLINVDMSQNKLGASEIMSAEGLDTSGALAAWLRGKDCVIQNLDLSWNSFRKSSVQLCQALGANANTSLLNLNLSYNALGEAGGVALGAALIDNKTLKTLNVAHNNLNSIAAFTICVGIAESSTLESVVLDGNPIGETGLAAMMVIPLVRGTRVTVSAKQCNLTIRDSGNWFRFDHLPGVYVLKLDDPFERAIALMLLRLVAFHRSCTFASVKYDKTGKIISTAQMLCKATSSPPPKSNTMHQQTQPQPVTMDLTTVLLDIRDQLNEKQQRIVRNFEKLIQASEDGMHAVKAFQDADVDGNGGLDKREVERLLHTLGIELSAFRLGSLMATFDSDGNGAIDFEEFQAMLLQTKAEHQRHLSDLCCLPIIAVNMDTFSVINKSDVQQNCDAVWGDPRFIPKKQGSILMQVVDERVHKPICHTLPSCNRTVLEDMAAHTPDPDLANRIGMKLTQVRVDDAVSICNSLSKKQDRNKNDMVIRLLKQMASVEDCRLLISEVTGNDRVAAALLKRAMGACWYSTQGMLNGFYELDLSKKHDRECLLDLYARSKIENNARAARSPLQYGLIGDVSQKGNWSSFRNEMFNQNPIVLNDEFVNEMPVLGQLQFDFSGEPRPEEVDGVPVVSVIKDVAVVELLVQLQLIKSSNSKGALEVLEEARALCNRCLRGDGHTVFETKVADAQEIGLCRSLFFENLGRRSTLLKNASRLEDIGAKSKVLTTRFPVSSGSSEMGSPSETDSMGSPLAASASSAVAVAAVGSGAAAFSTVAAGSGTKTFPMKKRADAAVSFGSSADNCSKQPRQRANSMSAAPTAATAAGSISQSRNRRASAGRKIKSRSRQPVRSTSLSSPCPLASSQRQQQQPRPELSLPVCAAAADPAKSLPILRSGLFKTLSKTSTTIASEVADQQANQIKEGKTEEVEASNGQGIGKHLFNATEGQHFYGVVKPLTKESSLEYLKSVTQKDDLTPQAKMRRVVDAIEDALGCYMWIRCRHLALLLACVRELPHGMCAKTKYFGNYRVDIVVMLFGHIVDRHNFQLVLRELTPFETACVSMRIGMLNYFNPMSPEGAQSLDISRWEERLLAKAYVMLETHEPGENWVFKQFKWTIDSPHIPGWVLTTGWVEEATMPTRGILDLSYYSGEGEGRHNCAPLVNFRKSLLYMTTLEEGQFKPELTIRCRRGATDSTPQSILGRMLSPRASDGVEIGDGVYDSSGDGAGRGQGLACLLSEESLWRCYLGGQSDPDAARSVHAPRRKNKTGAAGSSGVSTIPVLSMFTSSKFTPKPQEAEVLPVNGCLLTGKMAADSSHLPKRNASFSANVDNKNSNSSLNASPLIRMSSSILSPLRGNIHSDVLAASAAAAAVVGNSNPGAGVAADAHMVVRRSLDSSLLQTAAIDGSKSTITMINSSNCNNNVNSSSSGLKSQRHGNLRLRSSRSGAALQRSDIQRTLNPIASGKITAVARAAVNAAMAAPCNDCC